MKYYYFFFFFFFFFCTFLVDNKAWPGFEPMTSATTGAVLHQLSFQVNYEVVIL